MQHLSSVPFESFYLEKPYHQELLPAFKKNIFANYLFVSSILFFLLFFTFKKNHIWVGISAQLHS